MPEKKYVEMICQLSTQTQLENFIPPGFEARPLAEANQDELYRCYCTAFQAGDAAFFFDQSEAGRREYFDTLGLEQVRSAAGSSLILKDEILIGFTFVLPYREKNCHISCMCVAPEYQRLGVATFMLHFAIKEVAALGNHSITLGTDTNMAAFQLYRQNGFEIVEE
jgi:ribosomal protein S18 acetylase RimI-like enzyme